MKKGWKRLVTFLVIFFVLTYSTSLFYGGMIIGMTYQQAIIENGIVEFGEKFNGEVNINLNETELIEGFREVANESMRVAYEMGRYEGGLENDDRVS